MYQDEHEDHPDFKFPVDVKYVGVISEDDREDYSMLTGKVPPDPFTEEADQEIRDALLEVHALIYTDGSIALTLYEAEYFMWGLRDGCPLYRFRPTKGGYRLTSESVHLTLEHYRNEHKEPT